MAGLSFAPEIGALAPNFELFDIYGRIVSTADPGRKPIFIGFFHLWRICMYTYEKSIFIDRPQQVVFEFVTNPANHSQWSSVAESARWTSIGRPGVGSTYGVVVKFGPNKMATEVEITGWDPYAMVSTKGAEGSIKVTSQSRFEPKETGTQLTLTGTLQGTGVGKLMEGLFGRLAERQEGKDLDALKRLLESQRPD